MNRQELENWIKRQRDDGFSDNEIRRVLNERGFTQNTLDQAFADLDSKNEDDQNPGGQDNRSSGTTRKVIRTEFNVSKVVKSGLETVFSHTGLRASGLLLAILLVFEVLNQGFRAAGQSGSVFGIGETALAGMTMLVLPVFGVIYIKVFRMMLGELGASMKAVEGLTYVTTMLKLVAGWLMYILAVIVGLVLLIIPGIYLAIALFFWDYGVVQGRGLIESFKHSYGITKGHKWQIAGISFLTSIIGSIASAAFSIPAFGLNLAGYSSIGAIISLPGAAASTIITITIMGTVYVALSEEKRENEQKQQASNP